MAFIGGTVKSTRGAEISVERLPSGRLTKWCEADFRWSTSHQKSGEGHGNGPELTITLNGTEYTTRNVSQSGGSDARQVVAIVRLPDGDLVRLCFHKKTKWSLMEPEGKAL